MSKIPIQNIYYLILYAFDLVKNKNVLSSMNLEVNDAFSDVLIKIFNHEVDKIIKRGIYHNYTEIEDETVFIKGKFNVKESLFKTNKKLVCNYDEFNNNQLCNKIIKFTLNKLLFANNIDSKLKKQLRRNYFYFESVPLEQFTLNDIKKLQLNRQNNYYKIAIKFAIFLNFELIPKNKRGNFSFIQIFENEETMNQIYESFLYNFYKINLDKEYHVKKGSRFNWELTPIGHDSTNLPQMETDIEIRRKNQLIIIDAKYYKDAFSGRYSNKFISTHLYQMHAYLNHYHKEYKDLRGILLYPSNGYNFFERYKKDNHYTMEFATVNLSKEWSVIHQNLIDIIKSL